MGVDWRQLSQEEADRLALAQEHRVRGARAEARRGPGHGLVVRRSLAWIAVWAASGYAIWQATPS